MQTSLALARTQLRHGWRNLAGIVVLVALIGGLIQQPASVLRGE